jgi:hypothetical protein
MNPTGREELFAMAANGNTHAYQFLYQWFDAADVADDIEDEEKVNGRVARVLMLMTTIPANPFYVQHAPALRALMVSAIISWDLSNAITEDEKYAAFYAAQIEQVVFYVALVCGGDTLAKRVASEWVAKGGVKNALA